MFTVYFNATQERGRGLSPAEIKASDVINVGMLEEVTDAGLCSWHDIPTEEDVKTVRAWIAANLGNYTVDVTREVYNDGSYCTEEDVVTGVPCVEQIAPAADAEQVSTFGAILCANGKVEVTEMRGGVVVNFTRYNSMEEAESWTAWKVAQELGKSAADVEAVAVKTVPGVYEIKVTVFGEADASQVAPAQAAAVAGYYYEHNKPDMTGAQFLKTERQKLDPIQGGAFVSIGYYRLPNGQTIGIVF